MLVGNTRLLWVLVVLPCIYLLVLLHRHSHDVADKASDAFDSLQHYTHKLGEVLPWTSPWTSQAESSVGEPWNSGLKEDADWAPDFATPAGATTSSSANIVSATSTSSTASPLKTSDLPGSTIVLPYLQELCQETKWAEGLWLQCTTFCGPDRTAFCGGLNNARDRVQTCLRMAIEAGAGAVIPQIMLRGLVAGTNEQQAACTDTWFDLAHMNETISTNCPQLKVAVVCPDAVGRAVALPPPPAAEAPLVQIPPRDVSTPAWAKGEFRAHVVYPMLNAASRLNATTNEAVTGTTTMEYGDTFGAWDYSRSNELATVRWDLYRAVRFQKILLRVGEMIRDSPTLQHGSYIAVHLRGEADWPVQWGSPAAQMALYSAEMAKIRETDEGRDINAVFVSSGDQNVIQVFRDMLAPLNYTVHDKWTILSNMPQELALVQQQDFDSKGIVDHAVLTEAKYFMGIWTSTFSQNVALSRTIDDDEDFLNSAIYHNATMQPDGSHIFGEPLSLQGNNFTKIIVTNGLG